MTEIDSRTSLSRAQTLPGGAGVTYKLQREVILPLAWGPAVLLQFAHPLVAHGVAGHSRFRSDRWGRMRRFHRTLDAMLRLCFGRDREARGAASAINAIHDRVHGRLPKTVGIFPAGTVYSAHDPVLLAWVQATLLAMNVRVYELCVAPLSVQEKDRYCMEASAIEEHLGIPRGYLPRSFAELQRYIDNMLASGVIAVSDAARSLAGEVLDLPRYPVGRSLMVLLRLVAFGLLPPAIREDYGFPWTAQDDAKLRASAARIHKLLPLAPPIVRYWPAARAALRRSRATACSPCPSAPPQSKPTGDETSP
jgi:uncharacterized protein (DUF2236 family)